jgi:hypothetical protein
MDRLRVVHLERFGADERKLILSSAPLRALVWWNQVAFRTGLSIFALAGICKSTPRKMAKEMKKLAELNCVELDYCHETRLPVWELALYKYKDKRNEYKAWVGLEALALQEELLEKYKGKRFTESMLRNFSATGWPSPIDKEVWHSMKMSVLHPEEGFKFYPLPTKN